jgi:hypothetical protein
MACKDCKPGKPCNACMGKGHVKAGQLGKKAGGSKKGLFK